MRILQINSVANTGSTGRIAENIGLVLKEAGHESYMAFGRPSPQSNLPTIQIGNQFDVYAHGLKTVLTDKHGFGSKNATKEFIKEVEKIQPDAIGLHNLHGYYINIEILFDFLKASDIPVLWTLFDCWAFTGHCSYFDDVACEKWKIQCHQCPKTDAYPRALVDNSEWNFNKKKELFTRISNLEIVTHSHWLKEQVSQSFFKEYTVHVTPSAIDTETFKPRSSALREKHHLVGKRIILGCANVWSERKGLKDFIKLCELLNLDDYAIVLIGLTGKQIRTLPTGMLGLERTEGIIELAEWYTVADVFLNPTYQDNFPTTNLEALSCGTPLITYDTGGSPEAIDENTGSVVPKGDLEAVIHSINYFNALDSEKLRLDCRIRAEQNFNSKTRYRDYVALYEKLIWA